MDIVECESRVVGNDTPYGVRKVITSLRDARIVVIDLSEVRFTEDSGPYILAFLRRWVQDHDIRLKLFNPTKSVRDRLEAADSISAFEFHTLDETLALLQRADTRNAVAACRREIAKDPPNEAAWPPCLLCTEYYCSELATLENALLEFDQRTGANSDIYVLPLDGAHTPRPLIATRFDEQYGMFSPDGKWLAFVSNESGNDEVYVQPFGREGLRSVVSTGGGVRPMWSHDGKNIHYSVGDAVMQVAFDPASGNIGQATVAARLPQRSAISGISSGGEFVGVRKLSENHFAPELEIVTGWLRELSERVPKPY